MTRCVDLFIQSGDDAATLAATIAARAGFTVEHHPDDGAPVVVDGAVRAVLRPHGFTADDDLVLSRYRWALTASTDAAGHLGDTPETRTLRRVSSALSGDHPVLLVLDLQYRAEPRAATAPGEPVPAA